MRVFRIPMRTRFRGQTVREGVLIEGPAGWGEFSPFPEYGPRESSRWLACAREAAFQGWPEPLRAFVPVNTTVPAVSPEQAFELVRQAGCGTAKVKVAEAGQSFAEDLARVEAVRDALGPAGKVRVDANGAWSVSGAVRNLKELDRFAVETSVGLAAGLALAAALPELPYACGLGTMSLLAGDVVADSLVPVEGLLAVRRPVVDLDVLSSFEIESPSWLRRLQEATA